MAWDVLDWGQFITMLVIAIALGMDAFSLGIGIGMAGIRFRTILKISVTIGFFHIIMPIIGLVTGIFLNSVVGDIAAFIGGGILCLLGLHMLWNGFFEKEKMNPVVRTTGLSLILFSVSVSMDALSVGFSFGLFAVDAVMAVILFGIIGTIMAGSGLMLGRTMGSWLGNYGEILGGAILLFFGIKFLI